MSQPPMNPAILSPASRFAIPQYRSHSRSPSRSPNRRHRFTSQELDPLISNLSPTSTLEALTATDAISIDGRGNQNLLQESIADSSTSERALGIRAALAGKKLRDWYTELKEWDWPSIGFGEPPTQQDSTTRKYGRRDHVAGNNGPYVRDGEDEYWGSLPSRVIQKYEDRIDVIKDDMETLEVEELKDHVRNAHLESRSRPSSRYGVQDSAAFKDYNHLNAFTAVITATIMQALPYISRLNSLLDIWSIRLVVLRQVPGFLYRLEEAQNALESAWFVIGKAHETGEATSSNLSQEAYSTMRSMLESRVSELGQRIDAMLDLLETDSLPEKWVEDVDNAEESLASWIVEAERQVSEYEWERVKELANRKDFSGIGKIEKGLTKRPQMLPKSVVSDQDDSGVSVDNQEVIPSFGHADQDRLLLLQDHHPMERNATATTTSRSSDINTIQHDRHAATDDRADIFELQKPISARMVPETASTETPTQKINSTTNGSAFTGGLHDAPGIPAHNAEARYASLLNKSMDGLESDPLVSDSYQVGQVHPGAHERKEPQFSPPPAPLPAQSHFQRQPGHSQSQVIVAQDLSDFSASATTTEEYTTFHNHISSLPELENVSSREESRLQSQRPAPLTLHSHHGRTDSNVSDASFTSSTTSGFFSNMSSPEILDASRAEYFGSPTEVVFPGMSPRELATLTDTVSRQSSQRTAREVDHNLENGVSPKHVSPAIQRSRAPSFVPEPTIHEDTGSPELKSMDNEDKSPVSELKRASITSIEVLARSELRSIAIRRSGSYSSTSSALSRPQTDPDSSSYADKAQVNDTDARKESMVQDTTQSLPPFIFDDSQDDSPSRKIPSQRPATLESQPDFSNLAAPPPVPPRSSRRPHDISNLGCAHTSTELGQRKNVYSPDVHRDSNDLKTNALGFPKTTHDQLEARISSILTNIPAPIRLTSGPEADAPEVQLSPASPAAKKVGALSPAMRLTRAQTSTITLAPAYPKSRSQSGDPEIKLYHLHQPGKDVPIKLFVRMVGEGGERVMVRVGGGWADLGEYLREYASHHGKRSISGGRFEIQGLPQPQSSSPVTSTPGPPSGRTTPNSRPESPLFRPASSLNSRKLRTSDSPADSQTVSTPEVSSFRQQDATPGSVDSVTPSFRSSSRMSWTDEDVPLGLAGPKSRRAEISPGKQAWVEGMMDQAKKASTSVEKKKVSESEFGDLGKVGNTKRVFFRSKKDE